MPQLFANGASGTLAANITNFATTITVTTGNGLTFPDTINSGDYYYCTIENAARTTREIVKVTNRTGDVFTVLRGQDLSAWHSFAAGDFFELRIVRASLQDMDATSYISNDIPVADSLGAGHPGDSILFSRSNHQHPTDIYKASTLGSLSQFTLNGTTSADFAGLISNKTGYGLVVMNTSPTFVSPILGTPTSGSLVNCTFPILNQNTTGNATTATTCTGNAATATQLGLSAYAQGGISNNATQGTIVMARNGSTYDYSLINPNNSGYIMTIAAGTLNATFGGNITAPSFVGLLTGNANTATLSATLTNFVTDPTRPSIFNYNLAGRGNGMYSMVGAGTNGPGPAYLSMIQASNGTDTALQIAGGYTSDNLYFRGTSGLNTGTGYSAWRTVIHSGNVFDQVVNNAVNSGWATHSGTTIEATHALNADQAIHSTEAAHAVNSDLATHSSTATLASTLLNFVTDPTRPGTAFDWNSTTRVNGLYSVLGIGFNGPGASYLSMIQANNGADVALQIAGGYNSDNLYFRGTAGLNTGTAYTPWRTVIHSGNYNSYFPAMNGTGAYGTWPISITGMASYAVLAGELSGNQTNWASYRAYSVSNMMGWKNYGNGHVIFDASGSSSPDPLGAMISNVNSQIPWSATYPTLMGWNGVSTYGVRVDNARIADTVNPGFVIPHATFADSSTEAAHAVRATTCGLADVATAVNPGFVIPHATFADSSTNANHAIYADVATDVNGTSISSTYMTLHAAVNPYSELHKPGVVAYKWYINAANQLATCNTNGSGVISGADNLTIDSSGNMVAKGDITAFSDARLKTNVITISNALNKVTQMRGVEFDKDGKRSVGVIAQEVQQIVPEVVLVGEEYMSVAYGNLVGVLIEAIKELKLEVDYLKGLK